MLPNIEKLKAEHPFWGYRRVWAYLKFRQRLTVNRNRVYRIMKENRLLVPKNAKLKAKRYSTRPKPRADCPNQYWGMDMTKIMITDYGWMYLHVVKDWFTKEIVGYSFSHSSTTLDWLAALNTAVNRRFPRGILRDDPLQLALVTDNGSQPTSMKFIKECADLKIKQIFTTWNNPKGNADTERVMRTIKEDLVWIYDWKSPLAFEAALVKWIKDYNEDFPHQSLNNKTPCQFFNQFQEQSTLLNIA